jgi:hypothetical protein
MMPLTLSPPLVLADADGDAAVVAGMATAIPAASAPVTFVCTVYPGIADNAHDREAARPSHPRKYGPGYWPAGGGPLARVGLPHDAVLIEWCLATAARRALCVPTTCRRPFLYSRKGLSAPKSGPGDRTGTPPCPRQNWHGGSTPSCAVDELLRAVLPLSAISAAGPHQPLHDAVVAP